MIDDDKFKVIEFICLFRCFEWQLHRAISDVRCVSLCFVWRGERLKSSNLRVIIFV